MTTLRVDGKRLSLGTWRESVRLITPEYRPVCVVVPVRNERETIVTTLTALVGQLGVDHAQVEILVLANNCDDDTADQVRDFTRQHPGANLQLFEKHFPDGSANIGSARRWLMDKAACRLPAHGIIASTDGDTVPDLHWLAAMLREFDRGVGCVGGRILTSVSETSRVEVRRMYLQDTVYRLLVAEAEALLDPDPLDPWPRHFQHFSANLAITREAYLAVGGLPDVPVLEDMALYKELLRHDIAIRHSPCARVTTSSRFSGRVDMGLSTQLSEWQTLIDAGMEPSVESAPFVIARIHEKKRLRGEWLNGSSLGGPGTCGRFIEAGLIDFSPPIERLDTLSSALHHLRSALVELRRSPESATRSSRSSRYVSA